MKNFQVVSLAIFGGLAIFGLLTFSGAINIGKKKESTVRGTAILWGPFATNAMLGTLSEFNSDNKDLLVKYVAKDPSTYEQELLDALASGVGPDMFFVPDYMAYDYRDKVYVIPYTSFPLDSYRSAFAGAGEVFLTMNGILAMPISIDPLMLYYNRSMLDSNNIVFPPTFWDDLLEMVPVLTKTTEGSQVLQSAVALGQFQNIQNAKDILAMLFMQLGNPIVREDTKRRIFVSALDDNGRTLAEALTFFTDFSNPLKSAYSWNLSLPNSREYFLAENSAFYFGLASEYSSLVNQNPNINLGVAEVPQIKGSAKKVTSAHTLGIAVSRFSKNPEVALAATSMLVSGDFVKEFLTTFGLVPARRDLLAQELTDSFYPYFYRSALYADSWLDPRSDDSDQIFAEMVGNVLSNTYDSYRSIDLTDGRLNVLLLR